MAQRFLQKTWVSLAGGAVIIIGIILLPLPGPGTVVIAAGLAILATEFTWAERLLAPLRRKLHLPKRLGRGKSGSTVQDSDPGEPPETREK